MRVYLICALLLGYVSGDYIKSGVKGGLGGGVGGRRYQESFGNIFGTSTHLVTSDVGVCMKEVPTATLVRDPSHVPKGNGSRSDLSIIKSCCKGYIKNIHNPNICDPICTPECVNALCTAPDTCSCFPDSVKNRAGFCVPTCPIGCQNGECSGGECICKNGYKLDDDGQYCVPVCNKDCGPYGNCTVPDVCTCKPGYRMAENESCYPVCYNCDFGKCVSPNNCQCIQGYRKNEGGYCVPYCSKPCGPDQLCVGPEVCRPHSNQPFTPYPDNRPNIPSQGHHTFYNFYENQNDNQTLLTFQHPNPHKIPTSDSQISNITNQQHQNHPNYHYVEVNSSSDQIPYTQQSNYPYNTYNQENIANRPNSNGQQVSNNYPYLSGSNSSYQQGQYYNHNQPHYTNQQNYPLQSNNPYLPHYPTLSAQLNQLNSSNQVNNPNQTNPVNQPNPYQHLYPNQPFNYSQPLYPNQPFNPNHPFNPNQTFYPYQPYNYNQPLYSNQLSSSNQPLNPNKPLYPNQQFNPYQPLHPNQPMNPNQPFNPYQPLYPNQPMNPYQPLNSNQTLYPNQPFNSYIPYQPNYANQPFYPNQSQYPQGHKPHQTSEGPMIQPRPPYGQFSFQNHTSHPLNFNQTSYYLKPSQGGFGNGQETPRFPECSQPCINGICVEGNQCSCNPGYIMDITDQRCKPHCPGGCPNGVCSAPNLCICNMGYYKDTSVKGRAVCVKRK